MTRPSGHVAGRNVTQVDGAQPFHRRPRSPTCRPRSPTRWGWIRSSSKDGVLIYSHSAAHHRSGNVGFQPSDIIREINRRDASAPPRTSRLRSPRPKPAPLANGVLRSSAMASASNPRSGAEPASRARWQTAPGALDRQCERSASKLQDLTDARRVRWPTGCARKPWKMWSGRSTCWVPMAPSAACWRRGGWRA